MGQDKGITRIKDEEPGLVVKADGSRSIGRGFEPRRRKTRWTLC